MVVYTGETWECLRASEVLPDVKRFVLKPGGRGGQQQGRGDGCEYRGRLRADCAQDGTPTTVKDGGYSGRHRRRVEY